MTLPCDSRTHKSPLHRESATPQSFQVTKAFMPAHSQPKFPRLSLIVVLSTVVLVAYLSSTPTVAANANVSGKEAKRSLRPIIDTPQVAAQHDHKSEDRALAAPKWLKTVLQKWQTFVDEWRRRLGQRTANQLFRRFKVHKMEPTTLLGTAQYRKWEATLLTKYKGNYDKVFAAIVTTLTVHHGDNGLRRILTDALRSTDEKVVLTATLLENAQLRYWTKARKSADEVFQFLGLHDESANVFTDPLLGTWISYVKTQGNDNPFKLLLTKVAKWSTPRQVADMLVAAPKNDVSIEVRGAMFDAWMADSKTVEEVFDMLEIGRGDNLLESPVLDLWISYARRLKQGPQYLLFAKLQHQYKHVEADVALAIATAIEKNPVKGINDELTWELFEHWKTSGKSGEDVYNLLGLEGKNPQPMAIEFYMSYMVDYLEENPHELFLRELDRIDD